MSCSIGRSSPEPGSVAHDASTPAVARAGLSDAPRHQQLKRPRRVSHAAWELLAQADGEGGLVVPLGRLKERLPDGDLQLGNDGDLAVASALALEVGGPSAADAPEWAPVLGQSVVWQRPRS
jgi:hypothetical protein